MGIMQVGQGLARVSRVLSSAMLSLALATTIVERAAALQASDAAPAAVMLRMRDGSIQWGSIATHDPDGLTFVRIENGGQVHLPWSLLQPEQEDELRRKWGYVDLSTEEVMMSADRLALVDGGEVIGLIIDRTPDALVVKRAGTTAIVPKNRISAASTAVQVPALELYTKDELYNRELGTAAPVDAEGNYKLGEYCERILDFTHAAQHYKRAQELDAKFRPEDVKAALVRTAEKAKAQDQIDYLTQVDLLLARKKYDEALTRADAFKEKYPDSPLLPDAKRKHDHIVKARERDIAEHAALSWYSWAGRLSRAAAMKPMTLEQTLGYIDDALKKDILEHVTKDTQRISKEATPDTVRKLWVARKKLRWYHASYGMGTWLLGKDAALKGEQPDAPKAAPQNDKDKARAELEQKVQRYLQNTAIAKKAQSKDQQKDDREEFWKEFGSDGRTLWILAYYAENGGEMECDKKPELDNCRECGGTGVRDVAVSGANVAKAGKGKDTGQQLVECPACHGLGRVRRINFR
jgi:hypothetical protein